MSTTRTRGARRTARRSVSALALALCIAACDPDAADDVATVAPAAGDPQAARAALLEIVAEPDAFAAARRLAELLPGLGAEAVPTVMLLLEDVNVHLRPAEIDLLVRFWARHAPADASRWAQISPADFRQAAIMAAFETWAETDPDAAIQALILASGERTSRATTNALIRGWYAAGVPGLLDYIRDLGVSIERQRALGVYARAVIDTDGPDATMRWAESLPAEPWRFKRAAWRQLATELAKVDIAAARTWCDAHCEDEQFGSNLRERIAHEWAKRDGRAAMGWLASAPPGQERYDAVRAAFRGWRVFDQEGLFAWFESFDPSTLPEWLQPAAGLYAMAISWESPTEALRWAEQVPDAENRDLAMLTIARRWREVDEAAADAWLEQSPLSPEQRAKARTFPDAYRGRKTGAELNRERRAGSGA